MKASIIIVLVVALLLFFAVGAYTQYRRRWIPVPEKIRVLRDTLRHLLAKEITYLTREINYHNSTTVSHIMALDDGGMMYVEKAAWLVEAQAELTLLQAELSNLDDIQ